MDLQKISDAFKAIAAEFQPQLPPPTPTPAPTNPTGTDYYAATEGDLHSYLTQVKAGDRIILKDRPFVGNFTLPAFTGTDWVEIVSEPGGMATIVSNNGSLPLLAMPFSHHWRLNKVGFTHSSKNTFDLFRIGEHTWHPTLAEVPHHFEILGCEFYVQHDQEQRRAININATDVLISGTRVWGIKEFGRDSAGIASSHSPGRIKITNCDIEAASENILFGGDDPIIKGLIPTDIEITNNIIRKPLTWINNGQNLNVKNLLELKNAKKVLIKGNVFDGCWKDGQDGYAIVFTPRNQSGKAPWCTVEDVLFAFNTIKNSGAGVNILGTDNEKPSDIVKRIRVRDNLMILSKSQFGGAGYCVQINGGIVIEFNHNTMLSEGSLVGAYGTPTDRFTFINNVGYHGAYGIFGAVVGSGNNAIAQYFPNGTFLNNIIAGSFQGNKYPKATINPTTAELVAGLDVEMKVTDSRWIGAGTDGRNLGYNSEGDYENWY